MKRIQAYILGLVALFVLAGCSSHHHYGMGGAGKGDAYWEKGQQDMASLIDSKSALRNTNCQSSLSVFSLIILTI